MFYTFRYIYMCIHIFVCLTYTCIYINNMHKHVNKWIGVRDHVVSSLQYGYSNFINLFCSYGLRWFIAKITQGNSYRILDWFTTPQIRLTIIQQTHYFGQLRAGFEQQIQDLYLVVHGSVVGKTVIFHSQRKELFAYHTFQRPFRGWRDFSSPWGPVQGLRWYLWLW